ncbi:helix-turn-helix domain-containing protein [Pelagibacterium halotolerans]|uniref:helix-turn-helix domain-containing protein n=1 Tax=Pelagibacterium halotolerans TaxID=531813 RepID=UPI00384B883F
MSKPSSTKIRNLFRQDKPDPAIWENLKALRRDKGMTLSAAAAACSVSTATLSRIENGHLSPTFDVISKIAEGMGVGLSDFLFYTDMRMLSGWRSMTRGGSGRIVETPQYRFELLCDDVLRKAFLVLRATVLKRSLEQFGPLHSHSGHEQIIVQTGRVEVWTEHYKPEVLGVGDSMAFDSTLGHALISLSEDPATVLWICDSQKVI